MKKKIYITLLAIVLVSTTAFIVSKEDNTVLESKHTIKNTTSGMLSLLVETGYDTGKYTESTSNTWPDGYTLNKTLSKCENGSTLEYDEENKKVEVAAIKSDRCYIYFDVVPDIYIDTANVPTTYGTLANLSCSGATSTYNDRYQRIEISQINTKNISCNLNYTNRTSKTYLNNKIIGLSGTTQGTGQIVNEKGYRYEGQDPNNYIWFNNELWRIIGVFDSTSHGVANTNLVKIIRNESIGELTWDKSNINNWSTSSLKNLLNMEYLNSADGTDGANCYGYSTTAKAKCDYTRNGIKDKYKGMIKEVTWYLGGYSSSDVTADAMYGYERNATSKYSSNPASIENTKIGLMYTSDYGYAVPATDCARSTNIGAYGNANCTLNNWLYGKGIEWTITPNSGKSNYVCSAYLHGYVSCFDSSRKGSVIRPVLYLESNVYVLDGNGSITNPYIIGM